jgi:hypothetical protein
MGRFAQPTASSELLGRERKLFGAGHYTCKPEQKVLLQLCVQHLFLDGQRTSDSSGHIAISTAASRIQTLDILLSTLETTQTRSIPDTSTVRAHLHLGQPHSGAAAAAAPAAPPASAALLALYAAVAS